MTAEPPGPSDPVGSCSGASPAIRHGRPIGIAGAGLTGAVIARELAERGGRRVVVFEERDHLAGNCHSARDPWSGVMVHTYGAHVFHTDRRDVWEHVNRFARFRPFVTRIKAMTARGVFSFPINLLTINQLFGATFTPREAREFLATRVDRSIVTARSFEEQALSTVGPELYEIFLKGYTRKHWGVDPRALPASVLRRLPVRFSYEDDYFSNTWQAIPEEGYTELVARMLDHPSIEVRLGERLEPGCVDGFERVFWSGPLDTWFGFRLGRLGYRTLRWQREEGEGDLQGAPGITFCEERVPHVRTFEYRHFTPWERHTRSVAFRQLAQDAGPADIPYYPLRLRQDLDRLDGYVDLAHGSEGVTFVGRLGTYRYLDMHVVVGEALDVAARFLAHEPRRAPFPALVVEPHAPPVERAPGPGV